MPEQEKNRQAASGQDKLTGSEQLGESIQEAAGGAADVNPMMIVPVVVIAAVMALLLALVYGATKEPIAEAKRMELQNKLAQVMPVFDNDPGTTAVDLSETVKMYTGLEGDDVSGFAFTSLAPKSYSGGFSVIFGITPDGKINKVRILTTKETPGLGSKADPVIVEKLEGVDPATFKIDVTKDGGDVDAISGATITSRAVCDAVNLGLAAFEEAGGADAAAAVPTTGEIQEQIEAAAESAEEEAEDTPVEPAGEEDEDGR